MRHIGDRRDAQQDASERAPAVEYPTTSVAAVSIAVLGVVYGDIGTSPIYALRECFIGKDPIVDPQTVHYFIGHVDLFEGGRRHGMSAWRDRLFIFMARNTEDATAYYQIPAARAMKVGLQVGI